MSQVTVPRFQIQQIALVVRQTPEAKSLLTKLGLETWILDTVVAEGEVFGEPGQNTANLHFNYQAGSGHDDGAGKPLELEILEYTDGLDWMSQNIYDLESVSHFGMHVSADQLLQYREFFTQYGIPVAQEVITQSHTNEYIKDSRDRKSVV